MRLTDIQIYGYSRDSVSGAILNYHRKGVSNTIHASTGAGGNTDQIVAMIYEAD